MPTCAETRPGCRSRVSSVKCCREPDDVVAVAEVPFDDAVAAVPFEDAVAAVPLDDAAVGEPAVVALDGEQACHKQGTSTNMIKRFFIQSFVVGLATGFYPRSCARSHRSGISLLLARR